MVPHWDCLIEMLPITSWGLYWRHTVFQEVAVFHEDQVPISQDLWISSLSFSSSSNDGYGKQHNGTYSISALITGWIDGAFWQTWPSLFCSVSCDHLLWVSIHMNKQKLSLMIGLSVFVVGGLCKYWIVIWSRLNWLFTRVLFIRAQSLHNSERKMQDANDSTLLLNITTKHLFHDCEK